MEWVALAFIFMAPAVAVLVGFLMYGIMADSLSKCESCGDVYSSRTDLLAHEKGGCSHGHGTLKQAA